MRCPITKIVLLLLLWGGTALYGQEQEPDDSEPITGGVTYNPVKNDEDKLRDPFKSPFEIEQEEKAEENKAGAALDDEENRLPFNISEIDLKGVYLQAETGYVAIFQIGDDYDWYKVGVKFRDGDLVNITDEAVVFKHYVSDDDIQVREVVKKLHRGEE